LSEGSWIDPPSDFAPDMALVGTFGEQAAKKTTVANNPHPINLAFVCS